MKKDNMFSTFDPDLRRLKIDLLNPISDRSLKSARILKRSGFKSRTKLQLDFSQSKTTPKIIKLNNIDLSQSIYPQWLLERADFKDILDCSSQPDIGKICRKPFKLRNSQENYDLLSWTKDCRFFKTFTNFTCSEVCEKLKTVEFKPGETVVSEGEIGDRMFIIISGTVSIYNSSTRQCIDTMGKYNIIGEKALESNMPRSATVKANGPLTTLQLLKEDYINIIMRHRYKEKINIVVYLKTIKFFKDLLQPKLEVIAWNMIPVNYNDGQIIYNTGQASSGIYFIKEGTVNLDLKVTVTNSNKIPNEKKDVFVEKKTYEKIIRVCKPQDFFGEEELLSSCDRKTRAICKGNTEIFLLKKEFILEHFSLKEKKAMMKVNKKLPTVEEIRAEIQKGLSEKTKNYYAVLDATNTVPLPEGRDFTDSTKGKKSVLVKSLLLKHMNDLNENLLKKEYFFK